MERRFLTAAPHPETHHKEKFAQYKINEVTHLGYDGSLNWKQTPDGLAITTPDLPSASPAAITFRIK